MKIPPQELIIPWIGYRMLVTFVQATAVIIEEVEELQMCQPFFTGSNQTRRKNGTRFNAGLCG